MLALAACVVALYTGDAYVQLVRDFTQVQAQPHTVFAIEFFAGWCGHCQVPKEESLRRAASTEYRAMTYRCCARRLRRCGRPRRRARAPLGRRSPLALSTASPTTSSAERWV